MLSPRERFSENQILFEVRSLMSEMFRILDISAFYFENRQKKVRSVRANREREHNSLSKVAWETFFSAKFCTELRLKILCSVPGLNLYGVFFASFAFIGRQMISFGTSQTLASRTDCKLAEYSSPSILYIDGYQLIIGARKHVVPCLEAGVWRSVVSLVYHSLFWCIIAQPYAQYANHLCCRW